MKLKKENVNDGNVVPAILNETFDVKAIETVKATPEEVLSILRDANNRRLWDSGVT